MFRRSGHSDERRRRVLLEDPAASAEATATAKTAHERKSGKTRRYSDAALAANQPPVTCIVPARNWTLAVLLLSGLTVIALLNLLHAELERISGWIGAEHSDALNFAVRGNLAAWLSSVLLAWAAVMSAKIFNLRRHRLDDYKGRYRIWIWLTVALVMASIDAATGLHDAVGGLIVHFVKQAAPLGATGCWVILAALVVTTLALRMAIEMAKSAGTLVSLGAALACYAAAVAIRTGWIPIDPDVGWHVMVSATLVGHLLIWFTTLSYSAHVFLDAQGLLDKKPKEAKAKKKKDDATAEKPEDVKKDAEEKAPAEKTVAGKQVRIDAAHQPEKEKEKEKDKEKVKDKTPAPAPVKPSGGGPLKSMLSAFTGRSSAAQPAAATASTATAATADAKKLSRAERKKLRREGRAEDDSDDDE